MDQQPSNGILEEFRLDFIDSWQKVPNKAFFGILLVGWLALFQFLGNSTLGYAPTPSLFGWMYRAYVGSNNDFGADEAYALFIPLVVLGLFWVKRRELLAVPLATWAPGLLLVTLGLVFHVLGYVVQQSRISVVGLFVGLYGIMGVAWGRRFLRASLFPFFLLLFCVPLGSLSEGITFRLRLMVCQLVEVVSHYLLQIDIIRDGTKLVDPTQSYQYEVAAACSGIRSLTATLAFAVILGFFSFRKLWKRTLVIASAFPFAVFGNLLRMLSIVIAAELGGQSWGNYVHEGGPLGIFSLMPYIPAFVGLLLLERYLGDSSSKPPPSDRTPNSPLREGTTTALESSFAEVKS
jgi:exosortase